MAFSMTARYWLLKTSVRLRELLPSKPCTARHCMPFNGEYRISAAAAMHA
jgi:hypothetical protein